MDESEGNETGATVSGEDQTPMLNEAVQAVMAESAPIQPLDVLEAKLGRLTDEVRHMQFRLDEISALLHRHYPNSLAE